MFKFEDIMAFRRKMAALPDDVGKFEACVQDVRPYAFAPNEYGQWERFYSPSYPREVILACSADTPMTEELYQKCKHKAKHWFSVNKQTHSVRGIPIGVSNRTDFNVLWKHMHAERTVRNLAYMNFTISTCTDERQKVWDMFKDKPWVTVESDVPQDRFFDQVRNHRFMICPRGFGVDTHRLWESIYLGTIPIVKRHITHEDWLDLPVVWIDDWEEVTPEFLESVDMSNRNVEKVKLSYWVDQVTQLKNLPPTQSA